MQIRKILGIVVVGSIFSLPAAAAIRCDFQSKMSCRADSCQFLEITTYSVIDPAESTYARCDSNGCDTYPAEFVESGAFMNITVPGRSLMGKMSLPNAKVVEIATLGLDVLLSYGTCAVVHVGPVP